MTKDAPQTERFLSLYNREQRRLYALIRTMLYTPQDAEEVFQETCIALWRNFEDFQEGTNFSAWASQVARHRVLAFQKRQARRPLQFSESMLETLIEDYTQDRERYESRQQALGDCLGRLRADDRELLVRRYDQNVTTVELAAALDRPLNTLYKALGRIRRQLAGCIRRRLGEEEHPGAAP